MAEIGQATPEPNKFSIQLPANFDRTHRQVLHRYLQGQELAGGETWPLLIQAMDMLQGALVRQEGRIETFTAIYDRLIDAKYSDHLLEKLLASSTPEAESEALRATVARNLLTDLRVAGLWRANVPESQTLVAFCLYWWQMFVRGYAFEIAIYTESSYMRNGSNGCLSAK